MIHLDSLLAETQPACEDVRFLEDRLYAYNVEQTGGGGGVDVVWQLLSAPRLGASGLARTRCGDKTPPGCGIGSHQTWLSANCPVVLQFPGTRLLPEIGL